jgi:hypothetical protein
MFKKIQWLAASALVIAAVPADAAKFIVTGNGTVGSISALQNFAPVPPPAGAVQIGDAVSFSFRFDTATAQLQSLFDADPTINIYYLPVTDFVAKIGVYTYRNDSSYIGNASLQIWNDRNGSTDAQSFSFYGRGPNVLPFDTGAGQTLESFTINAFDNTATARSNDLIGSIAPFTAFASRPFSWLQYNPGLAHSVHVGGTYSATISAVPEPATWMMLIGGFGLVGGALRRRRHPVSVSSRIQSMA